MNKKLLDSAFERIKSEALALPDVSVGHCMYPKYALVCTCCIVPDGAKSKTSTGEGNWDFPYHIDYCPKHRDTKEYRELIEKIDKLIQTVGAAS